MPKQKEINKKINETSIVSKFLIFFRIIIINYNIYCYTKFLRVVNFPGIKYIKNLNVFET